MSKIEIRPTEKEIEFINEHYGKMKANEIARELNIPVNRVYKICQFLGKKHLNIEVFLTEKQEQVILSGILGDGNIKRNGRNFYYRETHSKKEKDYVFWKYSILKEHISKSGFRIMDNRDGQWGFQTINSPTFLKYKNMSTIDVINSLNEFGMLLYLLDDGWSKPAGYYLSVAALSNEERINLLNKINSLFNTEASLIQTDAISIRKKDIQKILPYFKKMIPNNIDIYKNKIQPLCNKFKI